MAIEVFDFRRDVKNVYIAPTVRGRFLRMEPGEVAQRHSHDLGDELFLVLSGQCEFEIEGEHAVLGPGQLCVARVDEMHQVWTVGDEPMTMFLTVTPHIEPTHTFWDEDGHKLPPVYGIATRAERQATGEPSASMTDLARRFVELATSLAAATTTHATAQRESAARLNATPNEPKPVLDEMWSHLAKIYPSLREMETVWNELAARVADST